MFDKRSNDFGETQHIYLNRATFAFSFEMFLKSFGVYALAHKITINFIKIICLKPKDEMLSAWMLRLFRFGGGRRVHRC